VALFDGINGPGELGVAKTWLEARLESVSNQLEAAAVKGNAKKEDGILEGVVWFRAYHSGSAGATPSQKKRDWPGLHASLRIIRDTWFGQHGARLSPHARQQLRDHFQVIATGQPVAKHEQRVGGPARPDDSGGALLDALNATK
jgi:hypothetical protein